MMEVVATSPEWRVERLPPREVHVWCVTGDELAALDLLRRFEATLDANEAARAKRFAHLADRNLFIVGYGMLRTILGSYLGVSPRHIVFAATPYGKPELFSPGDESLRFNLSHTSGLVAAAFAWEAEVGIDVERIRPQNCDLRVARERFSSVAWRQLCALPDEFRPVRFTEFWVLMEAYAKARGLGLSLSPGEAMFEISLPDQAIRHLVANEPQSARFWLMAPSPEHRMAVAAWGQAHKIVIRRLGSRGPVPMKCALVACSGPQPTPP